VVVFFEGFFFFGESTHSNASLSVLEKVICQDIILEGVLRNPIVIRDPVLDSDPVRSWIVWETNSSKSEDWRLGAVAVNGSIGIDR
jgi:hypothetical protein